MPLTVTGLRLQLFLSTQGLLIWFLFLRQLAFCGHRGNAQVRLEEAEGRARRSWQGGMAEAPYLSRRDPQGSHHPL